jgi:2-oxoglutarate ferredoxin oxidoreductase subunit gamma
VVVSDEEIFSPVASFPDYAVIMNKPSLVKYEGMVKKGGIMTLNSSLVDRDPARDDITVVKIPANDIARELKSDRTLNMITLGAFVAATGLTTPDSLMNALKEIVKVKKASLMELNQKGMEMGAEYVKKGAAS